MLTDAQRQKRAGLINSSDAAVVAGLSPYKSPLRLFYELRGEVPSEQTETEAMWWGSVLEASVAKALADKYGFEIRRQPHKVCKAYPFMGASIDRQIINDPRGPSILEVKYLNAFTPIHSVEDLPDHLYIQGQHQMAVWDYDRMRYGIVMGGQRHVILEVERVEAVVVRLVEINKEFLRRVELNDPPPPDGTDSTRDLLKVLYPRDTGTTITLDSDEARASAQEFLEAKAALADAENRKGTAEAWIKFRMGEASEAVIPGFGSVTWKSPKASTVEKVNVSLLREKYPEIAKEILQLEERSNGRRFLCKAKAITVTL